MIVRHADFKDVGEMVRLGEVMHAQSALSAFPFDADGAGTMACRCMLEPNKCAFVADDNGIVGVLAGITDRLDYADVKYATDILCFSLKPGAGVKLMRAFTDWAFKEQKADVIWFAESFGMRHPDKAQAFYKRIGAKRAGGFYVMERA